jgi:beta-lactamase regulating signal transducer with metallopeptidase domain
MLGILGLVLTIVLTVMIYRTSKQNGHNVGLWTSISILLGISSQLIIPIGVTAILAAVKISSGKSMPQIQDELVKTALIITVVGLVLQIVAAILIMKKISLVSDEKLAEPPPPPNDFNLYH